MLQAHGKLEEAVDHFREAQRIQPDYALAYDNLAAALKAHSKRYPAARVGSGLINWG